MDIPAVFKDVWVLFSNAIEPQRLTMTLSYVRESVIFSFGKNKRVEMFNVANTTPVETPFVSSIRVVFRNGDYVIVVHEQYEELLAALGAMQRLCNQATQYISGMQQALADGNNNSESTGQRDGGARAGADVPVAGPSGNGGGSGRSPSPSRAWTTYRLPADSYDTHTESDSD